MKIFLCLLLIKICCCLVDREVSADHWTEISRDDKYHDYHEHADIERPCSLHDVNCIRQYFAHNSRCTPVHGPGSDTVLIKKIPIALPSVNTSITSYDVTIKGLNDWQINNFYVKTDTLVLEVVFKRFWVSTANCVIKFHRKGEDAIVIRDSSVIEYKDLSLTLTVPHAKSIQLSRAHVFTYISDADPVYEMGPKLSHSRVPVVRAAIKGMTGNIVLSIQEAFVSIGPILMSAFLDYNICKF